MRDIYPRLAMVSVAAFALSGCGTIQSIFGSHSARMPELRMSAPMDAEAAIATATEEGRGHLDRGETGLAILAFQRAMSYGAPTPQALNGMGVAFARLGRYELARRYFREAAALAPSDERFAANLTRLNRSPAFAMRRDGDIAAALASVGEKPKEAAKQTVASSEPQPDRLTRVSSREYRVRTLEPKAAPLIRSAAATSEFKPLVRIEFSKPEAFNANGSGRTTVRNPHLGRTAAVEPRFRPVLRFPLENPEPARGNR